jgi:hypothetical protein
VTAAAALQKAIHGVLAADPALVALLGGPHIHDRTPANVAFPYVTYGGTLALDWSTGTEAGEEHLVQLTAWSRQQGRKQALDIVAAMTAALEQQVLDIDGHRLVLMRFAGVDAAYDTALRGYRASLRIEALTEPL